MTTVAIVRKAQVHFVPRENQSAAYRLFNRRYLCKIQQFFTMDPELIQRTGLPTTGDEKLDMQMRNEWTSIYMTPVVMVHYMERGAGFMLEDVTQANDIYQDIGEHMRNWLVALQTNPNISKAPLDDLAKFDDLASVLYPYATTAQRRLPERGAMSGFLAKRAKVGGLTSRMAMPRHLREKALQEATGAPGGIAGSGHQSLTMRIAELVAKRRKEMGV